MIFYRIGCYILIATCFIHLSGHFKETPASNEKERQLIDLMTNVEVAVGSFSFTMQNLLDGLSLCFSLLFLWTGTLSLVLSYQLKDQRNILFTIALVNTFALLIGTAISIRYFFLPPTSCFALALLFFVLSLAFVRRKKISA